MFEEYLRMFEQNVRPQVLVQRNKGKGMRERHIITFISLGACLSANVCKCVHARTHTHAHTHTHTRTHPHPHPHTRKHPHTHTRAHTHTQTHTHSRKACSGLPLLYPIYFVTKPHDISLTQHKYVVIKGSLSYIMEGTLCLHKEP